jgi:hypothetical protein
MAEDSEVQGEKDLAPREAVAAALGAYLTPAQLSALIDEALATTKSTWANCGKCGAHTKVEVSDARSVVQALSELLNQGFGRPSGEVEDRSIVVHRKVFLVAEDGDERGEIEATVVEAAA